MAITTLFLDIGGVLLTNGWDHPSRALAAKTFNLDPQEIESRHNLNFAVLEAGKLSLEEYLNRVVFYEKRPFTSSEFQDFMFAQSTPFPQMIEMVRQLKEQYNLKVVAVSNECRELNEYRIEKFKLDSFMDFYISSCFVHLRKPDTDIYRLALDTAHVSGKNVVYIEDRLMFVQVAEKLGIPGIQHVDYQTTREKLTALGLTLS